MNSNVNQYLTIYWYELKININHGNLFFKQWHLQVFFKYFCYIQWIQTFFILKWKTYCYNSSSWKKKKSLLYNKSKIFYVEISTKVVFSTTSKSKRNVNKKHITGMFDKGIVLVILSKNTHPHLWKFMLIFKKGMVQCGLGMMIYFITS